jgi:hypothetical protein
VANQPVNSVIAYIHGEMKKNVKSGEAIAIRDWLDVSFWDVVVPIKMGANTARANKKWYDMVKTGGPWDHKKHIRSTYGEWTHDALSKRLFRFDIWSNLHYGYVGASCGFGEDWLLAGVGVAQVPGGAVPAGVANRVQDPTSPLDWAKALDDPADQWAISLGYGLWGSYKDALTADHILNTVRAFWMHLSTKAA